MGLKPISTSSVFGKEFLELPVLEELSFELLEIM
jgi:hypothetical protein